MKNKIRPGSKYKPNKVKSTHVDLHSTKIQDGMLSVVIANYLYSDEEERNPQKLCMATKELNASYQGVWEVIQSR